MSNLNAKWYQCTLAKLLLHGKTKVTAPFEPSKALLEICITMSKLSVLKEGSKFAYFIT